MKPTRFVLLAALSGLLGFAVSAATFDCGSTGAYGPMNITTNTILNLPPNGIFNCTTITLGTGASLSFSNNALNTSVYLLATGDVLIAGTIDVSGSPGPGNALQPGKGGPGGFDGGHGGSQFSGFQQGGRGFGPGGGNVVLVDSRSTDIPSARFAGCYGNILLEPLIGGSGGGGSEGSPGISGSGGGGAVLIASNTKITVNGVVKAVGGDWGAGTSGAGSGGAIRLVAPVVSGNGAVNVAGGSSYWGNAGAGRIRVDCQENQAYRTLSYSGAVSRGSRMTAISTNSPGLDIIEVAGNPIPTGTNSPVLFELPNGASTNQAVKVQARNFTNEVPIRVVVTPENGPRGEFDAVIPQPSGGPSSTIVPVIIPAGSICQIHVWTR